MLEELAVYMKAHQLKLATAESCTAGLIASLVAQLPGSGAWLDVGFVVYSPDAKHDFLGVRRQTIERFGLTSEEVAREMAQGALHNSRAANVAVANTGIAGPSTGDSSLPVGLQCFAWAYQRAGQTALFSESKAFPGDRNEIRDAAARFALERIAHYHSQI